MGLWPPAAGGPARRPWGLPQPRATGSSGAKLPLRVSLEDFDYSAQRELPALSGRDRVWFCCSWSGYGFHEDGLRYGLAVAGAFGCRAPWHDRLGKTA